MAARDIVTLRTPMAEGIIRLLYTIALILIALGVLFGIARGVMIMTHAPMHRPAVTADANPQSGATTPQAPQTDAQNARPDFRSGPRGDFRGWRGFHHRRFGMMGPGRFGMMGRSPALFGVFVIVGALLRGLIALLIVRVFAEMGLAVLAMPRRTAA